MKEYPIELNNGEIVNVAHIGLNHRANGTICNNTASSYRQLFNGTDEVCIENSSKDIRHIIVGDIRDVYQLLRDEIGSKEPRNLNEYVECIEQVIIRYFGYTNDIRRQKSYYFNGSDDVNKMICISDLAHKNIATSIERAMVAQNLLLECSVDSVFKVSGVIIDDKETIHAYNLIKYDDKCYIFDATIPNVRDGKINPIICEIPGDVYLGITNPSPYIGYSVLVNHVNAFKSEECSIMYDAGREDVYKVKKSYVKKKVLHE